MIRLKFEFIHLKKFGNNYINDLISNIQYIFNCKLLDIIRKNVIDPFQRNILDCS